VAPRVLLLATKDTMAYAPSRGAVATGAELLRTVPPQRRPADVTVTDVLAEPSWDVSPGTMLALARRVRTAILDDGYDGVVVAHGTDTLEDTAFLTDLLAGAAAQRAGIVFTAATRPLDDPGSDAPGNLAAALTAAADPALRGAGALVCLNDDVHAARWVSHVDATSVAAFSSAPHSPVARVAGARVELLAAPPPRPPRAGGEAEPDVALIRAYPGIDAALLTAAVDSGARGLVLEGTGAGNVPVTLLTAIDELSTWDIPVVVASRCRTRDADLAELCLGGGLAAKVGAIGARGLPANKARVAVMVALGDGGGVAAVRDWFSQLRGA
jgi:L-asparaginase